jgi:ribonucleotide reductase beta subunit family protein with ferritin-like domain
MSSHSEILLTEEKNRYVLYPIKYNNIFKMYKNSISAFWTVEEIDLTKDIDDWNNKLTEDEKKFIRSILAFFAASDGIVNENLCLRFMNDVKISEARSFYAVQIFIEAIHGEMYSLMIDTFIKDHNEKNKALNAIENYPCIKKKAEWALKWISDDKSSFATRLIAFAIVEGVFFSGAFCSIYWLKERGIMPGLCKSNDFISRDEGLHTEFAVLLYSMISNRIEDNIVYDIFKSAVEIEIDFITDAIPCKMLGMNSELMIQFIKYVSDRLLSQLGYEKLYDVRNPFQFMERIGLDIKNNFFEEKESNYSVGNDGNHKFTINAEF